MNKGYTLIEILISMVIFSLISGAAFGIFSSTIEIQKYSLESQQLLGQTSYVVEYMSRAFRMAKRAEDSACIDVDSNYENPGNNDTTIKFLTYKLIVPPLLKDNFFLISCCVFIPSIRIFKIFL